MRGILGDILPNFSEEDTRLLVNSLDFVGLNHYTTRFISHAKESNEECHFYKVQAVERVGITLRTDICIELMTACFFLMVMLFDLQKRMKEGKLSEKRSLSHKNICTR